MRSSVAAAALVSVCFLVAQIDHAHANLLEHLDPRLHGHGHHDHGHGHGHDHGHGHEHGHSPSPHDHGDAHGHDHAEAHSPDHGAHAHDAHGHDHADAHSQDHSPHAHEHEVPLAPPHDHGHDHGGVDAAAHQHHNHPEGDGHHEVHDHVDQDLGAVQSGAPPLEPRRSRTINPRRASRFSCKKRHAGYYADMELNCEVYHLCNRHGGGMAFECPVGTRFQQRTMVCDHAHVVDCKTSDRFYEANQRIGQKDRKFIDDDESVFMNVIVKDETPAFASSTPPPAAAPRRPRFMQVVFRQPDSKSVPRSKTEARPVKSVGVNKHKRLTEGRSFLFDDPSVELPNVQRDFRKVDNDRFPNFPEEDVVKPSQSLEPPTKGRVPAAHPLRKLIPAEARVVGVKRVADGKPDKVMTLDHFLEEFPDLSRVAAIPKRVRGNHARTIEQLATSDGDDTAVKKLDDVIAKSGDDEDVSAGQDLQELQPPSLEFGFVPVTSSGVSEETDTKTSGAFFFTTTTTSTTESPPEVEVATESSGESADSFDMRNLFFIPSTKKQKKSVSTSSTSDASEDSDWSLSDRFQTYFP